VLSTPLIEDEPADNLIEAPDVDTPDPDIMLTEPAELVVLDPEPIEREPLEDTDDDPLCKDTEPAPSEELDKDNKPPTPLLMETEPPSCPDKLVPPKIDNDPPTKPDPEAIFTDPPEPDALEDIEPAIMDISPAIAAGPLDALLEPLPRLSMFPEDINTDPDNRDEV
jgi:hypothetical protein